MINPANDPFRSQILAGLAPPANPAKPSISAPMGADPFGTLMAAPPPAAPPPVQLAQAQTEGSGFGGISPYTMRKLQQYHDEQVRKETTQSYINKDYDHLHKKYEQIADGGQRAMRALPQLKLAKQIIDTPKFYSGPIADGVIGGKRFLQTLGLDPNSATANEVFEKIIAGQILNDIKVTLAGTGQVRVSEIDLLKQAAANRYNQPESNKIVMDLMMRVHKQAAMVNQVANAYKQGWIYDEKGQPQRLEGPKSTAGLDEQINKALMRDPVLTSDEISQTLKSLEPDIIKKPEDKKENKGSWGLGNIFKSSPPAPAQPTTYGTEPPPGFAPQPGTP